MLGSIGLLCRRHQPMQIQSRQDKFGFLHASFAVRDP